MYTIEDFIGKTAEQKYEMLHHAIDTFVSTEVPLFHIYCIRNEMDRTVYVGFHRRLHDAEKTFDYIGGSNELKRAYKTFGFSNFKKVIILSAVDEIQMSAAEKMIVSKDFILTNNGLRCYNIAVGGARGCIGLYGARHPRKGKQLTAETKQKMSKALTGRKLSPEHIAKTANANRGRKHSEAAKANMSLAQRGLKRSDAAKLANGLAKTGDKHPNFGKHLSLEVRQKISESNKGKQSGDKNPTYGKPRSEETKAKMRDSQLGDKNHMFGKIVSSETKKKQSESAKLGWLKRKQHIA